MRRRHSTTSPTLHRSRDSYSWSPVSPLLYVSIVVTVFVGSTAHAHMLTIQAAADIYALVDAPDAEGRNYASTSPRVTRHVQKISYMKFITHYSSTITSCA